MIIRTERKGSHTSLSNKTLANKKLSFRARGLLAFMLSLPDDWRFSLNHLEQCSDLDGRFTIETAVKELIDAGFITRKQAKGKLGKWDAPEWVIYEENPPVLIKRVAVKTLENSPQPTLPRAENRVAADSLGKLQKEPVSDLSRAADEKKRKESKEKNIREEEEEKINKKKKKNDSFDPLDLPIHLAKHPQIITAWADFIQHRREIGHKVTPTSWKRTITKMLLHTPKAIVTAIDTTIERGWTGIFFHESELIRAPSHTIHRDDSQPASLNPRASRLYQYTTSLLGEGSVGKEDVHNLNDSMERFYRTLPHDPHSEDRGPASKMSMDAFFTRWLHFLATKQKAGFVLQNVKQLQIGGIRWNEFIRDCERYTQYSFKTGEFLG